MKPLVIALSLLSLAACAKPPAPPAPVPPAPVGIAGEWRLVELDGAAPQHPSTLSLSQERAYGDAPCNHWSAKLVDDGEVWLGPIVATRAACAALDEEQLLLGSLLAAQRAELRGRELVLLDARGARLAAFHRG